MISLGADNYCIGCNEVPVIDALELMDCRYYLYTAGNSIRALYKISLLLFRPMQM